jgi:Zn-dependent peptidase ImmA (M78 family)
VTTSEKPKHLHLTHEQVEARARDVLKKHGLDSIPVNPLTIARREGIAVNNATFVDDSIAGMIARRGNEVTLLVNQGDPPYRKRFTIAHELGHHFLHLADDGEFVDGEGDLFRQPKGDPGNWTPEQSEEYLANMFATALLMPEDAVRVTWEDSRSLERMARRFNVSEQAMGVRLDQLGLLDDQKS